ncbi:HPr kinase/phosphatase C-terminal domain-containing protein [Chelativorans sp. AA-79]|uniref:HPr kinase/phosphatase C-terminal domain-containing protein n=1 Tax=Chelativorans sp. AA-79 TaxID=3028735 RepID=UPI0023F8F010|nr:HPr kinase/phosphatase C-terminal domain-containing protein [Chelativorans sp. AA-79]WEX09426.1 HPr kinase/phosphatase C-terminal domain-containing protein [Chelativorans sp. AA-79]
MTSNHHGNLLLADDRGLFIIGPSGAGKTALALALLQHCAANGRLARIVSDDQVFLAAAGGRLIGRAAPAIEGLAEARGFGPAPIAHERSAVIDLVIRLVCRDEAPRYQEGEAVFLEGIELPRLDLAACGTEAAVLAIAARLQLPPFG